MIKKSILAALVMLIAYHFLFPHIPRTYFQLSGPQRDNYFRAQRYVHDVPSETRVILGSSLSLRLNDATLGPGYYKLCLGGGSIFSGLEIIRMAEKRPSVILIEINQIVWNTDNELLHDLFTPWRRKLRNYSPIFKEEGRPANFANGIMERFVQATCGWGSSLLGQAPVPDPAAGSSVRNPALFSRLLRMYRDEHLAVAPPDLAGRVSRLGNYIDALIRDGSICVLYEMPIDSSLADRPSPVAVRRALETQFPKDRYHWLEFARDHNYDTYDGLHVSQAEADRLTETLVRQVEQISQAP
jgi:hypothetical protein